MDYVDAPNKIPQDGYCLRNLSNLLIVVLDCQSPTTTLSVNVSGAMKRSLPVESSLLTTPLIIPSSRAS